MNEMIQGLRIEEENTNDHKQVNVASMSNNCEEDTFLQTMALDEDNYKEDYGDIDDITVHEAHYIENIYMEQYDAAEAMVEITNEERNKKIVIEDQDNNEDDRKIRKIYCLTQKQYIIEAMNAYLSWARAKKFGEDRVNKSVNEELSQIQDFEVLVPKHENEIAEEERKSIIICHITLK